MYPKVLVLIKSRYGDFTSSEKKVADYILNNSRDTLKLTIVELANACGVSEATVVRFVKKLDLRSFQELKLSLATEINTISKNRDTDVVISPSDSPDEILAKVRSGAIRAIENTAGLTNKENFLKAAHFIRSAKRIEIYGVGSSAAVARILEYKLIRLGYPAHAINDPHMQAISAATMNPGDLVIGVSQSGSTKDIVDAVSIAKQHQASVICITEHVNSPLAQKSDVVIETFSGENPIKTSAGRSILAQIFAIEILSAFIYFLEPELAAETGEETAKAVVNKLY